MISEREAVVRERRAYYDGARDNERNHRASVRCREAQNLADTERRASLLYPLPKVERPRVENDPHAPQRWVWKVVGEVPFWSKKSGTHVWHGWIPDHFRDVTDNARISACDLINIATRERLTLILELMDKPVELVDADA